MIRESHDKNTTNSDISRNKGTRAFQYFCLQVRRDVMLRIKRADTKSHSFRRFSLISFSAPSFPLYAPEPFSFLASSPFFFSFFSFSPPFAFCRFRGKSPNRAGNILSESCRKLNNHRLFWNYCYVQQIVESYLEFLIVLNFLLCSKFFHEY